MRKKTFLTTSIIAVFTLAVMTSTAVYQKGVTNPETLTAIVRTVAQKFNLKEDYVQAVFSHEQKMRLATS